MTNPSASPIAATKERHRLAEIAARTGIHLAVMSGTVTVRCPLPAHGHPDRAPSLRLYLDDDRYYCFGCGAKGDIIQWVQDAHQATVAEAIHTLDSGAPIRNAWAGHPPSDTGSHPSRPAAGVDRPNPQRTPPQVLFAALDAAWTHYSQPTRHQAAARYLATRGIDIRPDEYPTGGPRSVTPPATPRRSVGHSWRRALIPTL